MEVETPASDTAFVASRIPLSLAQTSAPLPLVGGSSRPPARLDPLPAPSAAPAGSRERSRPGTSDVAALRQRVEARLLAREQTIASLTSWLLALYRVQQKVGSTYGTNSSSSSGLRSWGTVSNSTREEHLIKVALMLAGLRMQTCELVEAIFEWRDASPPLRVVNANGKEIIIARPFVWRGRWWPLHVAMDPPLLPLPLSCDPLMTRWFEEEGLASLWAFEPGAAPLALFAPSAWHPPAILDRIESAAAIVSHELDVLDLRPTDLARQRHAAMPASADAAADANPFNPTSAMVWSSAAPWTQDGAAAQLARLLYGGVKPFTIAIKALCRGIDAEMAAEYARRDAAAIKMQAALRGRSSRRELPARHAKRSFQQPLTTSDANAGSGLNATALRKDAGGRYAGTAIRIDAEAARASGKTIQQLLRDALTQNATRVADLFRDWDADGNGTISRREFRGAIVALGYKPPRAEVDQLFAELDADGSGLLDYRELGRVLRRGAGEDIEIAADLQAGAMGEIELEAKNRLALREFAKDGVSARAGMEATLPAIRQALSEDLFRVMDLMRALDADEDGTVTKQEFRKVLPLLGFDAGGTEALDELFETFDADKGGTVDYEELHKLLRKELKEEPADV